MRATGLGPGARARRPPQRDVRICYQRSMPRGEARGTNALSNPTQAPCPEPLALSREPDERRHPSRPRVAAIREEPLGVRVAVEAAAVDACKTETRSLHTCERAQICEPSIPVVADERGRVCGIAR